MVGIIERDEAFGVPRCLEYLAGIVDADHLVGRRVEDEEGAAQLRQPRRLVVPARLGEELLADPKLSVSQFDFRLSLRLDPLERGAEMLEHMLDVERGANRNDGLRGGDARCRRDDGRRSEEHTSELQSLMRISYAVF